MVDQTDFFGNGPVPNEPSPGAPNMDDFFDQSVNHDEVRKGEADALKPVGSYRTVPALTMNAERAPALRYDGSENPTVGRPVFRYYGPAVMTVDARAAVVLKVPVGTEIKGSFGFRISPARFNKDDGVTPDGQYKLWTQAVRTYEKATGSTAQTVREVVEFIRNYPVNIRVIQLGTEEDAQGEPSNYVVSISPVKA